MQLNGWISRKIEWGTEPEYLNQREPMERNTGVNEAVQEYRTGIFTAMVNLSFNISDSDNLFRRKSQYKCIVLSFNSKSSRCKIISSFWHLFL